SAQRTRGDGMTSDPGAAVTGPRGRAPENGHQRLAVLVKRFPRLSETFILNEFLELQRRGLPAQLFAIMDPHESQSQPEALAFIANKISGIRYSITGHAKDIYTTLAQNLAMRSRRAVFVATCTDANRRHLIHQIGLDPGRVLLCRHGVDLDRFARIELAPQQG